MTCCGRWRCWCSARRAPGPAVWIARRLGVEATLRPRGRPRRHGTSTAVACFHSTWKLALSPFVDAGQFLVESISLHLGVPCIRYARRVHGQLALISLPVQPPVHYLLLVVSTLALERQHLRLTSLEHHVELLLVLMAPMPLTLVPPAPEIPHPFPAVLLRWHCFRPSFRCPIHACARSCGVAAGPCRSSKSSFLLLSHPETLP